MKGVSNSLRDTWTIKAPEKTLFSRAFDVLRTCPFLKGTGCLGSIGVSAIDGFDVYLDTSVVQDSADGFP